MTDHSEESEVAAGAIPFRALRDECGSDEAYELSLRTLHTYASRLLDHPGVPRYKSISQHNDSFHRRLGQYAAGVSCLQALGYQLHDCVFRFEGPNTQVLTRARAGIEKELMQLLSLPGPGQSPTAADVPSALVASTYDDRAAAAVAVGVDNKVMMQHPAFLHMQNRYLDNVATLSEKVRAIDEIQDGKSQLIREQAETIDRLQQIVQQACSHEVRPYYYAGCAAGVQPRGAT